MSNSFKLCPTHFSRGANKILGGAKPPLVTVLVVLCHVECRVCRHLWQSSSKESYYTFRKVSQ